MIALENLWADNPLWTWVCSCLLALALQSFWLALRRTVAGRLSAQHAGCLWREVAFGLVGATHTGLLWLLSIALAVHVLTLGPQLELVVDKLLVLTVLAQGGLWGQSAIRSWLAGRLARAAGGQQAEVATYLGVLAFTLSTVLWSMVILLALSNLGFEITALVASLGIGGVAVALAVQSILGDLFASLSISIDKPFLVGDFVGFDGLMGTVRHVGLRTTRLESLSGEELVVSNTAMLATRIRNFQRMRERRVCFAFTLGFDTTAESAAQVGELVRAAIEAQAPVRFERATLKAFTARGLEFEAVYYVLDPDYVCYMLIHERVNLALMRALQAHGLRFAQPLPLAQAA